MRLALILGRKQGEVIKGRLEGIKDNLDIDVFDDVPRYIDLAYKKNTIYDRVLVLSKLLNRNILNDLYKFWGVMSKDTQIVLVGRQGVDESLANDFLNTFKTPVVATMLVENTTVQLIAEAVLLQPKDINDKYGVKDFLKVSLDEDAVVIPQNILGVEEPKEEPKPIQMEQQQQQTQVQQSQQKYDKKKGLFGGLFGGNKKNKQPQTEMQNQDISQSTVNQQENYVDDGYNQTGYDDQYQQGYDTQYSEQPIQYQQGFEDTGYQQETFYSDFQENQQVYPEQQSLPEQSLPYDNSQQIGYEDEDKTVQLDTGFNNVDMQDTFENPMLETQTPVVEEQFDTTQIEDSFEDTDFGEEMITQEEHIGVVQPTFEDVPQVQPIAPQPVVTQPQVQPIAPQPVVTQPQVQPIAPQPIQTQVEDEDFGSVGFGNDLGYTDYNTGHNDFDSDIMEVDEDFSNDTVEFNQVQQRPQQTITSATQVDDEFGNMNLGSAEEAYRQTTEQPKTIVKEVVREVVRDSGHGSINALKSILTGKTHKIIIVTGDRGTGVTSTALTIANTLAKKVSVLYFDCDTDNHGLLSYINYDAFRDYENIHMQGVKLAKNGKAFHNCVCKFENNLDLLTTDYSCDVEPEEIEDAGSTVAEVSGEYGVVVVDCPVDKIHLLSDLVMIGNTVLCVEGSKRGFMNMLCRLENSTLAMRYKRAIVSKGTMFITKVQKNTDMKKLRDYINTIFLPSGADWMSMQALPFNGKLTDNILNEVLD